MGIAESGMDELPRSGRALVAWYGVGAEVPASWSIVATSGSPDEGYLRADGLKEESLELRWKRVKRFPDLEAIAQQYLKGIQKTSRKRRVDYDGAVAEFKRAPKQRLTDLSFQWQSDRRGVGRLIYCRDCRRTVIAQVSGPAVAAVEKESERILPTLRDHCAEDRQEWGVYGLSFQVPRELKLIRQRLMSGFLSLNFLGKPGRVVVERWGLAEMLVAEGGLAAWHQKEYLAELRGFLGRTSAVEWGEHEALETEGVEGGLRRVISLVRACGLPGRAERFASVVWHCQHTNRIVGVRAFGRRPSELARTVAASVRCHT